MKSGRRGVVIKWFDEKGYGFIEPVSGGRQLFFHASSVRNLHRRDLIGQRVSYAEITGNDGRPAAEDVWLTTAEQTPVYRSAGRRRRRWFSPGANVAWGLALGFLGCVAAAVRLGYLPDYALFTYGGMSIITFIAYASDKSKAGTGKWRTPESTLHGLELLGGWPGALAAQWHIRHKNRKASYQLPFWIIVAINIAALVWFAQQLPNPPSAPRGEIVVKVY